MSPAPRPDGMDWAAVRDLFPQLRQVTYLNSCSMGALSSDGREALARFQDEWATLGASAWYELWMKEIGEWRSNLARLIGAAPDEVAWLPSVSAGLGSIASALGRHNASGGRFSGRHEVVVGDLEFPTAVSSFGLRPGTTLRWAASPDGIQIPAAAYAAAMGPSTQAVVASRVFYATGAVQPVTEIAAAARAAGALAVVDDYQATGQLPLDVGAVGADVVVGGSLKWLCGGVGCGWMHVRRGLVRELEPTHAGWWANAGMFDFRIKEFRFWDDARRFEGGEVNLPSLFTSNAAFRLLHRLGPGRVARRTQDLARDLWERLEDRGVPLRIHPESAKRTAIVMVPRPDAHADVARLAKAGIIVDDRPGCVRISPHFYNTEDENEKAVQALVGPSARAPGPVAV